MVEKKCVPIILVVEKQLEIQTIRILTNFSMMVKVLIGSQKNDPSCHDCIAPQDDHGRADVASSLIPTQIMVHQRHHWRRRMEGCQHLTQLISKQICQTYTILV